MRLLIQKQQQILKQNLSKFENRAAQITYSLNKIQYLLIYNQENEQNKEFIKNEYKFLQSLVAQVGDDLNAFQDSAAVLRQISNNNAQLPNSQNTTNNIFGDEIKIEEEGEKEKDQNSESNYDDIEDDDEDDEYEDQQSQQKSNLHQGVITRKKNIEKDKIYSAYSRNRNGMHGSNNYSSSVSESQNYNGSSGGNKDYNSNSKQVRKKKYSEELRKKLIEELSKKKFSYRKICKKYNINYGTAYYLINSIQKDQADQNQQSNSVNVEPDNNQPQKIIQTGNNNEATSNTNNNSSNNNTSNSNNNNSNVNSINNGNNSENNSSNNNNNGKVTGGTTSVEKQNLPNQESGRAKYTEAFKQKLYIEQMSGLTYKDISDKNNLSYETCYYLISTIKTQVSKDQQLNRQLKAQIAQFKEQLMQNKANEVSSKATSNKQNAIPTTTTLTRAQQAILNGTSNPNEKKSDINPISIDDDDDEEEENQRINDEKKIIGQELNNNQNQKLKIEANQNLRSPNVLQEEDSANDSDHQIEIQQQEEQGSNVKQEHKLEQEFNHLNDQSSEQLKKQIKKNEQEQSQNGQNKDSQSSTKGGLSSDNE
ncbi:cation channel family protein (macronuclear) [Tetrahymena thermophila SB210]|uniref:Cation channel family protein n=1 Tax=Tetrahymena thermophila (strain SB210) TaxID=312017 RepID=W7XK80_TETTS|nr:cation channel family protein [Tetrahymena thermophila SB210]EWS74684.1 cation channel family protein [Tetrahymena thermophila SB210]|eukprot:XP_012652774.1 cation channel family protein [Tetrahymena thermophila SB210]